MPEGRKAAMRDRPYTMWYQREPQRQCEATIDQKDDHWGTFTDRCDRPKGHRSEHRSLRTACEPLGWLAWPREPRGGIDR